MAMTAELRVNGTATPAGRYVSWAPSPCSVRLTDADGATTPVDVVVQNQTANAAARFAFQASLGAAPTDKLELRLSTTGTSRTFLASGRWGFPSRSDRDAAIQVRRKSDNAVLATVPAMVRIRKDANTLTPAERDRFLERVRSAQRCRSGGVPELPRHPPPRNRRGSTLRSGIPALAPCVPARPRTGAPENRPGGGPAVLALRSARPQPVPHELRGDGGRHRHRRASRPPIRCGRGARTASRGSSGGRSSTRRPRRLGTSRASRFSPRRS